MSRGLEEFDGLHPAQSPENARRSALSHADSVKSNALADLLWFGASGARPLLVDGCRSPKKRLRPESLIRDNEKQYVRNNLSSRNTSGPRAGNLMHAHA